MKKLITLAGGLLLIIAAQAQKQLINDPYVQLRTVTQAFTRIEVSGAVDIYLSQADDAAVAVSAEDEDIRKGIKTVVQDGVLKISGGGGSRWWKKGEAGARVYISFSKLEALSASGASDVIIAGTLKAEKLEVKLSGASDLKGSVDIGTLTLQMSSASDASLEGMVHTLVVKASGASDLKGYELKIDTCQADASGASDIRVSVKKELKASASGASGVYYRGNPTVSEVRSSGASSVSKKG